MATAIVHDIYIVFQIQLRHNIILVDVTHQCFGTVILSRVLANINEQLINIANHITIVGVTLLILLVKVLFVLTTRILMVANMVSKYK